MTHAPVPDNWYHGAIAGIKSNMRKRLLPCAEEILPIDQEEAARYEAAATSAVPPNFRY